MAYILESMTFSIYYFTTKKIIIESIQRDIYLRVYLPRTYLIEKFKEIFIKIGSPSRKFCSNKKKEMQSN